MIIMTYYSQCGQDSFLDMKIFKGFKGGYFVDVGAHDGIAINNTLFFEKHHGWKGINIEPMSDVYDRLVVNRPSCLNLNCAVSDKDGQAEFIINTGYTEMLSGLKNNYDTRHLSRLTREISQHGGETRTVFVDTQRLETIFAYHGVSRVHYLSIDVEGAEFSVIKSIDFSKVFIDVIGFENNFNDTSVPIVKYLETKGYKIALHSSDIFMIHKDSEFSV